MQCSVCREWLDAGDRFCPRCGNGIEAVAFEPAPAREREGGSAAPAPSWATTDGGELIKRGGFEQVPEFLRQFSVPVPIISGRLIDLASLGEIVNATPAAREYLLESAVDGYDWQAFPRVAPEPLEILIVWAESPDHVMMPEGVIEPRSELPGLPSAWGAIVWTRPVEPEVDQVWGIPGTAARVVELYLGVREEPERPIRLPVVRAWFPVSDDGRAMRLETPGVENMVQGVVYGSPDQQQRYRQSMLMLLHPLVLTLARRHGEVNPGELQAPRRAMLDTNEYPLAGCLVRGEFQVPRERLEVSGQPEDTLRESLARCVAVSELVDMTGAVIGTPGDDGSLLTWDRFGEVGLPAGYVFVEAHPGETSPAIREFGRLLGLADAWGGLCQMVEPVDAEPFVALAPGTSRVLEIRLAVQDQPGGLVRFPAATIFVPLDDHGDLVALRNGDIFGGPVYASGDQLTADRRRTKDWIGHIVACLSRQAGSAR
jgi:hypothetical protein